MSYDTEVLADSPVLYWRLGEPSGATAEDGTANNRDGTYTVSAYGAAGAITDGDTAVTLDGTDDNIGRSHETALNLADLWTLECWVKRGTTGTVQTMISKGTSSYKMCFGSNNKVQLHRSQAAVLVESTSTITDTTTWHHIVGNRFDSTTLKIYIDGVDVTGTVASTTLTTDVSTPLRAGADPTGASTSTDFYNGSIDEVAVFNTQLSGARVLAHYNAGVAVAAAPPSLFVVQSPARLA